MPIFPDPGEDHIEFVVTGPGGEMRSLQASVEMA